MKTYLLIFPLAAVAAGAAAQDRPADPAATAPALKYESAFADYRPYREEKLAPWRDLNDEVGRVGGHVGMFRGGQTNESTKPGPATDGPPSGTKHEESAGQAPAGGHNLH